MPRISSPGFLDEVLARYAGTRLGRQEIDGEIIEERADALWPRALIEAARVEQAPPLRRIVVGIDPPGSARPGADACGIVAAGLAEDGVVYVLEDASVRAWRRPAGRRRRSRSIGGCAADAIVAEVNLGGDMVRAVLQQVDATVPVRTRARRPRQMAARRTRRRHVRARQGQARRRAASPRSRTRWPTSGSTDCRPAARPTGWTRWSGR